MRIEWSLAARDDLDRIQAYIEQHSPRAAEKIWLRIYERVGQQADFPLAAPLYGDGPVRKLVISGTPYIVLYRVDGDVLKVEQVVHGARDF